MLTAAAHPSDTRSLAPLPLAWLAGLAIFVPGHMFGWIVEWTWLGVVVVICLLSIAVRPWRGQCVGLSVQLWGTIFGLLCGISALSLGMTLLRHQPINERDVAEMLRLPIYGLMACFFAVAIGSDRLRAINIVTRLTVLYSLACVAIYQFQIPVLYPVVQAIYAEAKVLLGLGVIRVPFPFENPNFLAYFLVMALAYFCFLRRSLLFVMLTTGLLFLTGSRSGWLSGMAVLACFALGDMIGPSLFRRVMSIGALALVILGAVIFWEQITSFSRVAELVSALQGGDLQGVDTARIRLDGLTFMLDWVERSPVLGWGPGRELEFDVVDNQYLSWVLAWGAAGLAVITVLGTLMAMQLWAAASNRVSKVGVLALLGGVGLMLGTGEFLENYRLFFLTLVYFHVFYESLLQERQEATRATAKVGAERLAPIPSRPT